MQKNNRSFTQFLTEQLNNQQQKAVKHKKGSLLVIAGAGSGKTRVITARITDLLITHRVPASAIIALTFTNKAAREMKKRVQTFLESESSSLPFIGTFHSYCLQLLKKNQELLDQPFFSILDDDDQQKLLQRIIKDHGLQKRTNAKHLSYVISQIKNQKAFDPSYYVDPLFESLYKKYEFEKKASKCLDFDDLLLEAFNLFEKHKKFKKEYQQQVRHILVDEYQDTNLVQHNLLKHMSANKKKFMIDSLCAVGDEDQSIYSWRGATVANMTQFCQDFPKTTIVKIEQNYRSVQPILTLANKVIQKNKQRNPKKLWSEIKGTDSCRLLSCASEYQEAEAIAQMAQLATQEKDNSIAVLYRTHFQSRAIEEALIKQSIPYKIIGGVQFYERKEVKDILAYMRLIINPFDRTSFFRVINCPTRGLGAKFQEDIHEQWKKQPPFTFKQCIEQLLEDKITKSKIESLHKFLSLFEKVSTNSKPSNAFEIIISQIDYIQYLKKSYELEEATARIENLNELHNALLHFEREGIDTIETFLHEVALMQEYHKKKKQEVNPVLLMTLHAAKGLEFNNVILPGLEDGILPSSRSLNQEESIEEERRLFYVGITRAKKKLLITHARFRYTYGTMNTQRQSRFLQELPNKLLPSSDSSYWNRSEFNSFLASWLKIKGSCNTKVVTFKPSRPKKTEKSFTSAPNKGVLKINQPVFHQTFGIGIVKKIEKRAKITYITAKFKTGTKKIADQFLKVI